MTATRDGHEVMRQDMEALVQYIQDIRRFLPTPMAQVSCQSVVVDAGDALFDLLGYSDEELIGKQLADLSPQRELMSQLHDETLEKASAREIECQLLRKDGQLISVLASTMARRDRDGSYIGYFVSFVDITELKLAEKLLRESRERLQQAQKMEALGQLAGGVAHDFNNFLSGISGYTDLVGLRLPMKSDVTRYIGGIHDMVGRASDLTQKLLVFSRKTEVKSAEVDLAAVVEEVITLLKHTVDPRIEVRFEPVETQAFTKGDSTQLQTALLNLALNARDAMPDGGALTIKLSEAALDEQACRRSAFDIEPGVFVTIAVIDTGIGMSADVRERLFEPFFTTKGPGIGTGLGLSTVYSVVMDHSGAIEVDSVLGRGTTFTAYLPRAGSLETAPEHVKPLALESGEGRILLIEDQKDLLFTAKEILTQVGYEVLTTSDGLEGYQSYIADSDSIDMVILDIVMPGLDGYEVLRRLLDFDSDTKVLMTSGFITDRQSEKLLELGARGFLQKPFRGTTLCRAVAEVLADR